jgi:hypothetical protein
VGEAGEDGLIGYFNAFLVKLIWVILLFPFASWGQVTSVEIQSLPKMQQGSSLRTSTFNESSKRLGILMANNNSVAILISELSASDSCSQN